MSCAPMMDWTDRHCRYFLRLLSPRAQLYTEMVTAAAIHHGDYAALLAFDPAEHPVALQVGAGVLFYLRNIGDLGDSDNNHSLCLGVVDPAVSVRFPAGLLTDPREDLNPETRQAVLR